LPAKYLISGPAPLGRILNYMKRVHNDDYSTISRGPQGRTNLDDWTICFMVGLNLLNEPDYETPKITFTTNGKRIYRLIKNMSDFPEGVSREVMLELKADIMEHHAKLYKSLVDDFQDSDVVHNFVIFLRKKKKEVYLKQDFYSEFGKIFRIDAAGFNRLPSLLQIAEFCDIIKQEGESFRIVRVTIESPRDVVGKALVESKRVDGRKGELEEEEEDFLADMKDGKIDARREKVIVDRIKRNVQIAQRLKSVYNSQCQICGYTFVKKDGQNYSEAHHLVPLGDRGSDRIRNLVILCPNCHRKLHFANVVFGDRRPNRIVVYINSERQDVQYDPRHYRALRDLQL